MKHEKDDWKSIESPCQEAQFWASYYTRADNEGIRQVLKCFDDAQAQLEYLEDTRKAEIDCEKGFEYLMDHFGDGGSIETMLCNVFLVIDENSGEYVYSAAVSSMNQPFLTLSDISLNCPFGIYNNQRMEHTLAVLSAQFCKCLQNLLPDRSEIFTTNEKFVKYIIGRAIATLEVYTKMVSRVVRTDFSLRRSDSWMNNEFDESVIDSLVGRLYKVLWIRSIHNEILGALKCEQKKQDFRRMQLLEVFLRSFLLINFYNQSLLTPPSYFLIQIHSTYRVPLLLRPSIMLLISLKNA